MGLFDFFKKKQETPEAQEALDKSLEKTKELQKQLLVNQLSMMMF